MEFFRFGPSKTVYIECAARIRFEVFGRSKRTHSDGDGVVPRAFRGVVFFFVEQLIAVYFKPFAGFEQGDTVNPSFGPREVFFKTPF